jgi:hypothetical protein
MIVLGIILVAFAGFFKAVMDKLQFHWHRSVFALNPVKYNQLFWNPSISWENKYKFGTSYKVEKFKFSTTLLVFVTDAWHLSQMSMTLLLFIGISMIGYSSDSFLELLLFVSLARILYGVTFELSFKHLLEA